MWRSSQAYGLHNATDSREIFWIKPYYTEDCLDRLRHCSVGNGISLGGIVVHKSVEAMNATCHNISETYEASVLVNEGLLLENVSSDPV